MVLITISTTYDRLADIVIPDARYKDDFKYYISCQGVREYDRAHYIELIKQKFGSDFISYCLLDGYGLSKNRNKAIDLALQDSSDSDYIYICDDDVIIYKDGLVRACQYAIKEGVDCVTGIIETEKGFFKNYKAEVFKYNRISCAKISSVEVLISCSFLKRNNITFDVRFGLGGIYPSGEEFIYCNDVLKCGGRIYFLPYSFCSHPIVSSGQDFYSDMEKIQAKGAMFRRVYGFIGSFFYSLAFSVKKWPVYRKKVSFYTFTFFIFKGIFSLKND